MRKRNELPGHQHSPPNSRNIQNDCLLVDGARVDSLVQITKRSPSYLPEFVVTSSSGLCVIESEALNQALTPLEKTKISVRNCSEVFGSVRHGATWTLTE